jgi:hypothetical protein
MCCRGLCNVAASRSSTDGAGALFGPFVKLIEKDCSNETVNDVIIWKDATEYASQKAIIPTMGPIIRLTT